MNTIDILIKTLGVQGGTIHELSRLVLQDKKLYLKFLHSFHVNCFDISDYDTALNIVNKGKSLGYTENNTISQCTDINGSLCF